MVKNKKAMTMTAIISVVLMAVVLLVVITVPGFFKKTSEQAGERAACEQSLSLLEGLKLAKGGELVDKTGELKKLKCQTEYLDISTEGDAFTQEVADHIYDCWKFLSKYGNLFDQTQGTFCFICKNMEITSTDGFEYGLVDYLKNEKAPLTKGSTYAQRIGEQNMGKNANSIYNFFNFRKGDELSVIVTFGTKGFADDFLFLDEYEGVGLVLSKFTSEELDSLGCSYFIGRTTDLEYQR